VPPERLEKIDLFDGPSWDARGYWDDAPRAASGLSVVVQITVGVAINLLVPAAFIAALAGPMWGFNQTLSQGFAEISHQLAHLCASL